MTSLEATWQKNLESSILAIPRCQQCKTWNWYPLPMCTHCQCVDMAWEEVAPEGRVYSWTRVHRNFSGYSMPVMPYIVGIIEITQAPGVRIPCYYVNSKDAEPSVNSEIKLVPVAFEDRIFWGFEP